MSFRIQTWVVILLILAVWASTLIFLPPRVSSDTLTYDQALDVLQTGIVPDGFVPNRILTTYLSLQTILLFSSGDGDIRAAWIVMNSIFFFLCCFFFYKIVLELFEKKHIALFGMVLLSTNYVLIRNASDYVMDVGGWAFYIMALYFTLRFIKTDDFRFGFYAAIAVAIGCFFKEYALLGLIALVCAILYQHRQNIRKITKEIILVGTIVFIPLILFYTAIYFKYHYSYFNWFLYAHESSQSYYASFTERIIEYIKTFGSLYTFGWFLFFVGLYYLLRKKDPVINTLQKSYIVFMGISALPIFVWPFITQRLLFPVVPFLIIVSCLFLLKYERKIFYFVPLLILYIITNFAMDAYVLPLVNIDPIFKFLHFP